MALADIVTRIREDNDALVARIDAEAAERAEALREEARAQAEAARAAKLAAAERDARREADRIVVSARLQVRDEQVAARRALIDQALVQVELALTALPEDRYVAFIAERIAGVARGGETLAFGTADAPLAERIVAEVARRSPGLELSVAGEPAKFERGVVVIGNRTRADLSLTALVEERRADLELVIAKTLFREEA